MNLFLLGGEGEESVLSTSLRFLRLSSVFPRSFARFWGMGRGGNESVGCKLGTVPEEDKDNVYSPDIQVIFVIPCPLCLPVFWQYRDAIHFTFTHKGRNQPPTQSSEKRFQ